MRIKMISVAMRPPAKLGTGFLDELHVPRAISAPPQLHEQWGAHQASLSSLASDIRLDEDYDRFYHAQIANGKKLPPPLDGETLYSEYPHFGLNSGLFAELSTLLRNPSSSPAAPG
ncbi:hypothetical protein H632_c2990p0, partial [Helicosporidium sp. ATCC 50920]